MAQARALAARRHRLIPLLISRAVRGFADGVVSVVLAAHFTRLGFSGTRVGALVTAMLLGSAVLTLAVGFSARRFSLRTWLLLSCALMAATGVGFALTGNFYVLLALGAVGTLNPSAGDVSVFLPLEQSALASLAEGADRTRLFGLYNMVGTLGGALGALLCAAPIVWPVATWGFWLYALAGLSAFAALARIPSTPPPPRTDTPPLARPALSLSNGSRDDVLKLTALFSLDSAGGGLVLDSITALWLKLRFGYSLESMGLIFFALRVLGAFSQLLSAPLSARFGMVRTMVFTHVPACVLLVLAGVAPTAELAVAFLLGRSLLSRMDVPIRQSLVMSIVPKEERAAAASVTNVPRSLAAAITPVFAGLMLDHSTFGWPLVVGGVSKIAYDVLLLVTFRNRAEV